MYIITLTTCLLLFHCSNNIEQPTGFFESPPKLLSFFTSGLALSDVMCLGYPVVSRVCRRFLETGEYTETIIGKRSDNNDTSQPFQV